LALSRPSQFQMKPDFHGTAYVDCLNPSPVNALSSAEPMAHSIGLRIGFPF
jgi:hypothetical protein